LQDGIFICSGLNQCFVGEFIAFGTFSILLLVLFFVLLSKDTGSTKSKKLWDNNAHPVSPALPESDGDDKKKEDNTFRAFL
jgi:hypothetical protein